MASLDKSKSADRGQRIAHAEDHQVKILVWNVESFTNGVRPNQRGISWRRLRMLIKTLFTNHIELAILLETGADTAGVIADAAAAYGYQVLATAVTGRDDPPAYNGENYVVLFHKSLREKGGGWAVPDVALVAGPGSYRGAARVTFAGSKASVCAIHAPSPSHDLQGERLPVIDRCFGDSRASVLCGDLNIREVEQAALQPVLAARGLNYRGPGVATSLRHLTNGVFDGAGSEPYDQVWSKNNDVTHVVTVTPHFEDIAECEIVIERCAEKFNSLRINPARAARRLRHADNVPALVALIAETGAKVVYLKQKRSERINLLSREARAATLNAIGTAADLLEQAAAVTNPLMSHNLGVQLTQDVEDIGYHLDLLRAALESELENLADIASRYAMSDHIAVSFILHVCPLS